MRNSFSVRTHALAARRRCATPVVRATRHVAAAAALLLAALPGALAAQQSDTIRLRELVVTATRMPVALADAPGTITVLTGADLRERGHRYVADALRTVPGIVIAQSSGPGSLTSLFIRGGESDYVQVLVDGVQVNDPGGALDWSHLRAEDIERIEVVRGPASVLYGSDAVAGVVHIFTRAGGAPRVEMGFGSARGDKTGAQRGGDFDTHTFDAALTGAAAFDELAVQYGASGAYSRSNGLYEYNSDYDNAQAGGRLLLSHERGDIAFSGRYTEREFHYPTSGSGAIADPNQFATGDTWSFGVDAGIDIARGLELRTLATAHDAATRTDDPADAGGDGTFWSTADQRRRAIDMRLNIALPRATMLTLGAEREWQDAQTAYESVSEFGTFSEESDESRRNTGAVAQLHSVPTDRIALTLGGRIDDNQRFGTFRTGRAALNIKPSPGSRLHAAFGTAFKEPTFFENYATGFTRGNPDLEPEESRSWEAGAEQSLAQGRITVSGTYFHQRFRNLIQYTATPAPDAPNYRNVGSAQARGLELGLAAAHGPLSASASYTYTATRVLDAGFGEDPAFQDGARLLRRPQHQAALEATLQVTNATRILLGARYVGSREDLDFTDPAQWSGIRTMLDGYGVVDATLVWTVPFGRAGLDATFGARNLLDAQYEEIYNFPTAGRVIHIGLRARLGLQR